MNIVFLGPPGIGKGTQAGIVSKTYGIPKISTGEMMREEVKKGTDLGKKVKVHMDSGGLVPDEVVIGIIKKRIGHKDCKKGFILDGFPRTVTQAKELERVTDIDLVLNLTASRKEIMKRMTGRLTCRRCGDVYHKKYMPPAKEGVCDKCGGELYHREDQKKEAIEMRLEVYEKRTKPLIAYYRRREMLENVNAEGGKEEVAERIDKVIRGFMRKRG